MIKASEVDHSALEAVGGDAEAEACATVAGDNTCGVLSQEYFALAYQACMDTDAKISNEGTNIN